MESYQNLRDLHLHFRVLCFSHRKSTLTQFDCCFPISLCVLCGFLHTFQLLSSASIELDVLYIFFAGCLLFSSFLELSAKKFIPKTAAKLTREREWQSLECIRSRHSERSRWKSCFDPNLRARLRGKDGMVSMTIHSTQATALSRQAPQSC